MAAESDFKAMFVKHWQVAKEFTLAVAEAMPAESYDFKPNPEELCNRDRNPGTTINPILERHATRDG